MDNLALEDWMPMDPAEGPPFPRNMGIYWPWYKLAVPLPEVAPPVIAYPPAVAPPVIAYPPPAVIPPAAPPVIAYPPAVAPPVIAYPPVAPPEVPPEVIYACPLCGAKFSTLSELEAHMVLVHPPEVPVPPPPKLPTVSISSAAFTPSEATVGDVVSGTISWMPAIPGSPEFFDFGISADLIDSTGRPVMNVLTAYPTAEIGMLQATPFSLDTRGLPEGWYGLQVHFSDLVTGAEIAKGRFLNLLHLLPLPEIPLPEVPKVPPRAIVSITAPDSAEPREKVIVDVKTTNLMEDSYDLGTELYVNAIRILGASEIIPGGASKTYSMSFYMSRVGPASLVANVLYQPIPGPGLPWVIIDSASEIVAPAPPAVAPPAAPTLPTADMFATPSVNLPTEVEIGALWSGNISIPTQVPFALQALPSLPSYPVNIGLQLQSPIDVATLQRTFTPGQPISLPVNFDTSVLTPGTHDLILNISDLQGNPLFSNVIGSLRALMPLAPPEIPPPPVPPAQYTLEVAIEPPGAGHVLYRKGPYSAGEVVTLVATPYPGYEFDHWGGWPPYPGVGSTSDALYLTMSDNWSVVAAFREKAAPPPPPEVAAPPSTEEELEAFRELALKVNIDLGGSYVAGILTPPAGWVGSVTEWSRHVQAETLRRWLLGEKA